MAAKRATVMSDGKVLADTTEWQEVEGNVYFPPSSLNKEYFTETKQTTHCPWKGDASYYTIKTGDGAPELKNAAWFYKEPYEKAKHIKNHVAFYRDKVDINVVKDRGSLI